MTIDVMDGELTAAYDACRRLHRRHDPTYYWATRRLPRDVRPATHALYGYVRTADEIVDGPGRPGDPGARVAALDAWERELHAPEHPIPRALVHAAGEHGLRLEELEIYMRSMRIDCGPVRISGEDELTAYMDGSAGSVGRIMAQLLGVPERHHADFGRLGHAFQLTNFIRDVREDWALDRIYLPGVVPEDLVNPCAPGRLRAVVGREVERARALFAGTEEAIAASPRRVRPGIRVACAVYRRVLDRVESNGFDVLGARSRLGPRDMPRIAMGVR